MKCVKVVGELPIKSILINHRNIHLEEVLLQIMCIIQLYICFFFRFKRKAGMYFYLSHIYMM